uniref:Glutathione peroxidase 3 n=1 Tax=Strigops habroptila TaxID=2489341 RepID=A0A672U452_STRHB
MAPGRLELLCPQASLSCFPASLGTGGHGVGAPCSIHGVLLTPQVKCYGSVQGTIYDYGALTIDGDEYIPFRNYAGKMVLFVNVATY